MIIQFLRKNGSFPLKSNKLTTYYENAFEIRLFIYRAKNECSLDKKDILCNQFNCLHTILIICFLQVLFFVADKLNKSYQL